MALWLRIAGQSNPDSLPRRAHRNNLDLPRPVDTEFLAFVDRLELLLDVVTSAAETKFLEYRNFISALDFTVTPGKKTVSRLRNYLPPTPQALRPLFESATQHWLMTLARAGFFELEWPPERSGTRYTPVGWPQGMYLERMVEYSPEEVAKIICNAPGVDNTAVNDSIAKIATVLPYKTLDTKLVERITASLKERLNQESSEGLLGVSRLGHLVATTISRMEQEGHHDPARELFIHLFSLVSPNSTVVMKSARRVSNVTDLEALISDWDYEQLLKQTLPFLVNADHVGTLTTLSKILDSAVELTMTEGGDDMLWITRPAIEDHEQNSTGYERVTNSLISSIRDTADSLIDSDPKNHPLVDGLLSKYQSPIFSRIRMHLMARTDVDSMARVREILLDQENSIDARVHHEYYRLIRSKFSSLDMKDREQICDQISSGPKPEQIQRRFEGTDFESDEEAVEKYRKNWQRRQLSPIWDQMLGPLRDRFRDVMDDVEPDAENDGFLARTGRVMVGAQGIPTVAQFTEADSRGVIEILANWEPSEDAFSGGYEDVGMELGRAAAIHPEKFSLIAPHLVDLPPSLLGGVFFGLRGDATVKSEIEWEAIVVASEKLIEKIPEDTELPTDLRSALGNLGSLIFAGMKDEVEPVSFKLRGRIWGLILELLKITPDFLDRDALTASINDVQALGMRAVGEYIRWVARNEGIDAKTAAQGSAKAAMPEIAEVLENHLETGNSTSAAVWSVYGQMLATLYLWDKEWLTSHLPAIFPLGAEHQENWEAAWEGYITHHSPHPTWLGMLPEQYIRAVDELDPDDHEPNMTDLRFGEMLAIYFVRGELDLDPLSDPPNIPSFFAKASLGLRKATIRFISDLFEREKDEFKDEHFARVSNLWKWRIAEAGQGKQDIEKELPEFGRLFSAGVLSDVESLELMIATYELADRTASSTRSDDLVIEHLATLADSQPQLTVKCLDVLIQEGEGLQWTVFSTRDSLRDILGRLLAQIDPDVRSSANGIVSRLESLGFSGFDDLIGSS